MPNFREFPKNGHLSPLCAKWYSGFPLIIIFIFGLIGYIYFHLIVGSNSIYCSTCSHWVHKACSGIKGRLKPDPEFTCSRCLGTARPINVQLIKNISISEDTLDVEPSFCYLGDMVSQGGGCLDGITTRIRCAWGKFRELLPLLTSSYIPLKKKGERAPTASDLSRIQRCDRSMSRWIC